MVANPTADKLNWEDDDMNLAHRYVTTLFLTAALAAPVALLAAPAAQEDRDRHRVYDKHHKDYHNWDDNENRAWGQYQTEHHKTSHEFSNANKREQGQYWNWRHAHPDRDKG